eukprot:gene16149-16327_t
MRAASYGDLDIIGINWALGAGARAGNLEIVQYLLEHQFTHIPYPDQDGINNAATQAALDGHLNIFHFLNSHQVENVPYPDEDIINELKEEHAPENEFVEILLDLLKESERDFPLSFQDV